MRGKKFSIGLGTALTIFTMTLLVTSTWAATHESVSHSFNNNGTDGANPYASLAVDGAGNFYGTTVEGGIHNLGTVFELSPREGGGWTERVLHSFGHGTDGTGPYANLVIDAAGNLYGTTQLGGIHNSGTVFELSPEEGGGWTETVLHSFNDNGVDGSYPLAGLIFDAAGNLYGMTQQGGMSSCDGKNCGTVFELSPRQGGGWTETVLHNFNNNGRDGVNPQAGLIIDDAGNLYGTTYRGGIHNSGTAFELSPQQGGSWTETVLHSFGHGSDGITPDANLTIDAAGNLYGTTYNGGIHGRGIAFELTPREGGGWTETVLHSFGNGSDGANPYAGLIIDANGNLYGTTLAGGIHTAGTAFELSPRQGGGWTETILHSFGNGTDGNSPYAGLIFDAAGNLYGTTLEGGIHSYGVVFEITP